MVDLIAKSPAGDLLPVQVGGLSLTEATPEYITSIMPYSGKETSLKNAIKKSHNMVLPGVGRTSGKASLRLIWSGRNQFMLVGNKPAAATLVRHAALTDQSDGWAVMRLTGDRSPDVLARLCPLDTRETAFKRGHTARTEIAHMMAVVSRISGGFEIMVMRSFAKTTVHHLQNAMQTVCAQEAI